ncbi:MAG: hydrogenase maturation peptidase HycI [Candidatus Bathyarchaeota archaeon]
MELVGGLRDYFGDGENRVVLVGVGNPMRADDGVGSKIIELLQKRLLENVMLINAETVPEAFTGKVEKYKPTHVMLIDAANFRGQVGETRLITGAQIGGQALSTHSLPLSLFISYIEKSIDVPVILLGIQPKTIDFDMPMSREIEEAAVSIADTLIQILSE